MTLPAKVGPSEPARLRKSVFYSCTIKSMLCGMLLPPILTTNGSNATHKVERGREGGKEGGRERQRERDRERQRDRERERQRERERVVAFFCSHPMAEQ